MTDPLQASNNHTIRVWSLVCITLAVAVWAAAWKRSMPQLSQNPAYSAPSARHSHGFRPQFEFEASQIDSGIPKRSFEPADLSEDLDPELGEPPLLAVPESVPVEDRLLFGKNHWLANGSKIPPPAPPRAAVEPEPPRPDDPRDFDLPLSSPGTGQ